MGAGPDLGRGEFHQAVGNGIHRLQYPVRPADQVLEEILVTAHLGEDSQRTVDETDHTGVMPPGLGQTAAYVDDRFHAWTLERINILHPGIVIGRMYQEVVVVGIGGAVFGKDDFLPEVCRLHGEINQGHEGIEPDDFVGNQKTLGGQFGIAGPGVVGYAQYPV
jgi:hypothetical protein